MAVHVWRKATNLTTVRPAAAIAKQQMSTKYVARKHIRCSILVHICCSSYIASWLKTHKNKWTCHHTAIASIYTYNPKYTGIYTSQYIYLIISGYK